MTTLLMPMAAQCDGDGASSFGPIASRPADAALRSRLASPRPRAPSAAAWRWRREERAREREQKRKREMVFFFFFPPFFLFVRLVKEREKNSSEKKVPALSLPAFY